MSPEGWNLNFNVNYMAFPRVLIWNRRFFTRILHYIIAPKGLVHTKGSEASSASELPEKKASP